MSLGPLCDVSSQGGLPGHLSNSLVHLEPVTPRLTVSLHVVLFVWFFCVSQVYNDCVYSRGQCLGLIWPHTAGALPDFVDGRTSAQLRPASWVRPSHFLFHDLVTVCLCLTQAF